MPATVLLLAVGPMLLPEHRGTTSRRFDLVSSALSLCAVLPIILGIKKLAANGIEGQSVGCIALGLAFTVLFFRRQRRHRHPMIDLRLFGNRGFSASLIANSIGTFALVGNAIFMTQHLQLVLGQSPLAAALRSLVPSIPVGFARLPAGVQPAVGESFQGALAASLHLHGQLAGQVVAAARTAFVDGMRLATTIGAVILVAAAIVTVGAVRQLAPLGNQQNVNDRARRL